MIFEQRRIRGCYVVGIEPARDGRGFFARTWCREEFRRNGLNPELAQCSIAFNEKKGTLRGLHYQDAPAREAKLVRCTRGAIYDVALDLRPDSETFLEHVAVTLSAEERNMLYVPEGCAHGYLTLEDGCEVAYYTSEAYRPDLARGVRWNDPAFGIRWPVPVEVISARDRSYPDFAVPLGAPAPARLP